MWFYNSFLLLFDLTGGCKRFRNQKNSANDKSSPDTENISSENSSCTVTTDMVPDHDEAHENLIDSIIADLQSSKSAHSHQCFICQLVRLCSIHVFQIHKSHTKSSPLQWISFLYSDEELMGCSLNWGKINSLEIIACCRKDMHPQSLHPSVKLGFFSMPV